MQEQGHKFSIPENVHYINCAYMSPILKSAEEAGMIGIARKRNPGDIKASHFFDDARIVRSNFGKIITSNASQIALMPSVSYGLKSAISNVIPKRGQHVITVSEEFPSVYFTVVKWAEKHNAELKIIAEPNAQKNRGKIWNERILDAINDKTALVTLSSISLDGRNKV